MKFNKSFINDSLFFYGDLYRRFYILPSSKKNRKLNIYDWNLTFASIFWLGVFCNEESSILRNIHPSEVVFRGALERRLRNYSIRRVHKKMSYNSKNIRTVVKIVYWRSRPDLFEDMCQKSCGINQNWGSCGRKETTYFKEPFLSVPPLAVLIMRIIDIIINMGDIRQERSNKSPILKFNKRLK